MLQGPMFFTICLQKYVLLGFVYFLWKWQTVVFEVQILENVCLICGNRIDISSFVSFDYLHIYCNARCIYLICKYLDIKSFIVSKVHRYFKCKVRIIFNLFPFKDIFHLKVIFIQYTIT